MCNWRGASSPSGPGLGIATPSKHHFIILRLTCSAVKVVPIDNLLLHLFLWRFPGSRGPGCKKQVQEYPIITSSSFLISATAKRWPAKGVPSNFRPRAAGSSSAGGCGASSAGAAGGGCGASSAGAAGGGCGGPSGVGADRARFLAVRASERSLVAFSTAETCRRSPAAEPCASSRLS